jgi:hypothetical protein
MFESGNSSNGNSDNPRFENLKQLGLENVVGYQFLFANVPFVYNVVDATQNQFLIYEGSSYVAESATLVTLPVGTYTSTQWPNIFTSALKQSGFGNYANYTSYYDTVTNQIVFVNIAASSVKFFISTVTKNNIGLYDVFGLNPNTVYTATLVTSNTPLYYNGSLTTYTTPPWASATPYYIASTYTASLSGPNEMYLHSDLSSAFKTNGLVTDTIQQTQTLGTIGSGDVIAFWPVNTVSSGVIRYSPSFVSPVKSGNGNIINNLQFYLTIGTQYIYSSANQYYGNESTAAGTDGVLLNYLPLGGTSWQIGIRFFIQGEQLIHESAQSTQAIVPTNQQPPRFSSSNFFQGAFPNKKLKI